MTEIARLLARLGAGDRVANDEEREILSRLALEFDKSPEPNACPHCWLLRAISNYKGRETDGRR